MRSLLMIASLALASCGSSGPPITVDAADLYGAFISNADAASEQYSGHQLVVSGIAGGVQSGVLTIIPGVQANLSSGADLVSFGEKVTVSCDSGTGGQDGVRLSGCALESAHAITSDDVDKDIAALQAKIDR